MVLRVERLAVRVDGFEVVALEGVLEHLQGQLDAFADLLDVLIVGTGVRQGQLQAVDHRQQVARELLQGELVGLLDILLGTTAHVLHVGNGAQRLVLGCGQLFLELQNTGISCIACTGFFHVKVFLVQLLISHGVSPAQFCGLRARLALDVGYMGPEKPASRGKVVFPAATESAKGHWQA
ncbi:hypothetical protein D3C79_796260 [compost metagenome]